MKKGVCQRDQKHKSENLRFELTVDMSIETLSQRHAATRACHLLQPFKCLVPARKQMPGCSRTRWSALKTPGLDTATKRCHDTSPITTQLWLRSFMPIRQALCEICFS